MELYGISLVPNKARLAIIPARKKRKPILENYYKHIGHSTESVCPNDIFQKRQTYSIVLRRFHYITKNKAFYSPLNWFSDKIRRNRKYIRSIRKGRKISHERVHVHFPDKGLQNSESHILRSTRIYDIDLLSTKVIIF